MFKKYGLIGLGLIIFAEITLFLKIKPFISWFCPFVWIGYILLIDSITLKLKRRSLMSSYPKQFLSLFAISLFFWLLFEFYNDFLKGWYYVNIQDQEILAGVIAFSTIVPAIFETAYLLKGFHLFEIKPKEKIKISKPLLYLSIFVGAIFVTVPLIIHSPYMWILVWTGFFFLLDPINYLSGEKSILKEIKMGKFNTILSLFVAGYICGFLWEFWNYWAYAKWYYSVPILENIKIFEMPVIGFLAYGPFAWELFVMYHFLKVLFSKGVPGI